MISVKLSLFTLAFVCLLINVNCNVIRPNGPPEGNNNAPIVTSASTVSYDTLAASTVSITNPGASQAADTHNIKQRSI